MTDVPNTPRGRPPQPLPDVTRPNAFARWLCADDCSYSMMAIARILDVSRQTIYAWRRGAQTPSLEMAVRLAGLSGGAVACDSWGRR